VPSGRIPADLVSRNGWNAGGRVSLRKRGVSALCRRPKGTAAPFGLAAAVVAIAFASAQTAYQDVGAPIATEPAVGESFHAHLIASPFGTIHDATFSFPQPVGTGMPAGVVRLAALDPSDVTGSIARSIVDRADIDVPYPDFPQIDRTAKGSRLLPRARPHFDALDPATTDAVEEPETEPEPEPEPEPEREPPSDAPSSAAPGEGADAPREGAAPAAEAKTTTADSGLADREAAEPGIAAVPAARIYFGTAPLGGRFAAIEPWPLGQAPILEESETVAVTPARLPGKTPRNETVVAKDRASAGGIDRSHFFAELDDHPGVITKLASMVYGEVGRTAPLETQMAQLESAFNRAQQRGQSVSHVLLSVAEDPKRGYYAINTYHPVSAKDVERFKTEVLAPVLAGSDLGHGVTGNASGSVAAHQFAKGTRGFRLRAAGGTKESYFMEGPITGLLPHFQPKPTSLTNGPYTMEYQYP
jgi:hypothetical protein